MKFSYIVQLEKGYKVSIISVVDLQVKVEKTYVYPEVEETELRRKLDKDIVWLGKCKNDEEARNIAIRYIRKGNDI